MIVDWASKDRTGVRHLFEPYQRARAIILPALDLGLGQVWVNSREAPTVARLQVSIINALSGDSSSSDAADIVRMIEPMQLVIGLHDDWTRVIKELWGERLGVQPRTLFSTESLDLNHLRNLREKIPPGYNLRRMSLEDIQRMDKRKVMHIPTFFRATKE
ncbi:MAG: GNAT family N-acetyltransferase, partial [Candidatus Thorarchaeota archaeon]